MNRAWETKPVLLLILATLSILVGTVITMVLPFAWVNTAEDRIAEVKPYNPLQLAGRDIYIREGCNNCHTQTVRPLDADVLRYGPYSRSGEFAYDRPFLWGSRRMGPDLHRIGGKYNDNWHYKHMATPSAMAPETNMPSYAFLSSERLDPALARKKMDVLGFPYSESEISSLAGKTGMDAMVAYLQKLGSDLPREKSTSAVPAPKPGTVPMINPYKGMPAAIAEGKALYMKECAPCHGEKHEGDVGPELKAGKFTDQEFHDILHLGKPQAGMPQFQRLGDDNLWRIGAYINSGEK